MLALRRMHYGAWIGILVILISGFAPMISQTLAAKRFHSRTPMLAQIIQASPLCIVHTAASAEADNIDHGASKMHDMMGMSGMKGMTHRLPEQQSQQTQRAHSGHQDHRGQDGQDGQEACGYCNLFSHSPFLVNTLPQLAAVAHIHHAFIAILGAAFRPRTVAAASRPQPPPLF
ncbi:DUF2946 family protein [Glaciimonas sp. CA11.2]|nr:DUF2946 family protein [Glaciimonas sp. CA11.2]MDY7546842.1 DUF2946 family protein [Glaciimonas sp. CA11.2]